MAWKLTMTSYTVLMLRLFVASYAPLALIFAVLVSQDLVTPTWDDLSFYVLALLGGWGLVDAWRLPRGAMRTNRIPVLLGEIRDESGQVAAYMATYLLPFLGLEFSGWRDASAVLIYLLVLFVVFVRSDLPLVNPALYVAGWRVVSATRIEEECPGNAKDEDAQRVLLLVPKDVALGRGILNVADFGRFLVYADKG